MQPWINPELKYWSYVTRCDKILLDVFMPWQKMCTNTNNKKSYSLCKKVACFSSKWHSKYFLHLWLCVLNTSYFAVTIKCTLRWFFASVLSRKFIAQTYHVINAYNHYRRAHSSVARPITDTISQSFGRVSTNF